VSAPAEFGAFGWAACWKLSAEGRCRLPEGHGGACAPVPYAGDLHGDLQPVPGPTGEYPMGKLNAEDSGGLKIGISIEGKIVRLDFGVPVHWIGLDPATARGLGNRLIRRADLIDRLNRKTH
jgi:hypothetical protein